MKPILLRIRKKTKVPTKRQVYHLYRYDWKLAGVISYKESESIFSCLGDGPITTDAQFAKLLYKNYGSGTYSILAWQKKRQGFWSFLKLELTPYGFQLLKKEESQEKREIRRTQQKLKKLHQKLASAEKEEEKNEIKEEIEELRDDVEITEEMMNMDTRKKRYGPLNYLQLTHPVYQFHQYENYNKSKAGTKEVEASELW